MQRYAYLTCTYLCLVWTFSFPILTCFSLCIAILCAHYHNICFIIEYRPTLYHMYKTYITITVHMYNISKFLFSFIPLSLFTTSHFFSIPPLFFPFLCTETSVGTGRLEWPSTKPGWLPIVFLHCVWYGDLRPTGWVMSYKGLPLHLSIFACKHFLFLSVLLYTLLNIQTNTCKYSYEQINSTQCSIQIGLYCCLDYVSISILSECCSMTPGFSTDNRRHQQHSFLRLQIVKSNTMPKNYGLSAWWLDYDHFSFSYKGFCGNIRVDKWLLPQGPHSGIKIYFTLMFGFQKDGVSVFYVVTQVAISLHLGRFYFISLTILCSDSLPLHNIASNSSIRIASQSLEFYAVLICKPYVTFR